MNWFKMLWLNSDERAILKAGKQKEGIQDSSTEDISTKPYKNIFYSNNNLTVVYKNGTMISKPNVTYDMFLRVKNAYTENQIDNLLIDKKVDEKTETKEEKQLVTANLDIFKGNSDFEIKGTDVYLKGVSLAMPSPVIASFIECLEKYEEAMRVGDIIYVKETYDNLYALRMFWLKLALNTLPQSREDLLVFCRKNDVRITRNGNLVLYRRIVTKNGADTKLVTFVTQEYYKCKRANADPREWAIAKSGDDYITVDLLAYDPLKNIGIKPFCNLQQMYLELPTYDTNTFTASHDRTVDIRLGGIYKIPDSGINLNNGICAAGGLHAACVDYNYSGFGDLPVVVLVNPSKAITVPMGETGKLRTTEMFIACVNDKPIGTHFDESALGAFDAEYHDLSLEQLEEVARTKSFETLAVKDTVPAVSLVDINAIREMLRSRVVDVI